ncbi:MAG: ferrochelatase [Rhodanobacter sp.]|jgi:ferrochelatase
MPDQALILVNLGSTPSTDVADVRRYLDQFLMDRHVIDVPWPLRRLIVSLVLRTRPAASAAAYRSIWWDEGSPLLVIGRRLQARVAERWHGAPVELAMRYGEPSIEKVLCDLARRGIQRATLLPLYPQFADSTVTTVLEEARQTLQRHRLRLQLDLVAPFHDRPEYLSALGASMRPYLAQPHDHLLLSYHGLPERHIRKADPTGRHCLCGPSCCLEPPANVLERCYRAQCVRTSERLTAALGVPHERWSLAFQSRLGRAKWIEPHTDVVLKELAAQGVRRLLVACPAFVADCIETLEEIGIRGRETFLAAGGEELTLIPCLNDQPQWADAVAALCRQPSGQTLAA